MHSTARSLRHVSLRAARNTARNIDAPGCRSVNVRDDNGWPGGPMRIVMALSEAKLNAFLGKAVGVLRRVC
jgi:hypothetical protein